MSAGRSGPRKIILPEARDHNEVGADGCPSIQARVAQVPRQAAERIRAQYTQTRKS